MDKINNLVVKAKRAQWGKILDLLIEQHGWFRIAVDGITAMEREHGWKLAQVMQKNETGQPTPDGIGWVYGYALSDDCWPIQQILLLVLKQQPDLLNERVEAAKQRGVKKE